MLDAVGKTGDGDLPLSDEVVTKTVGFGVGPDAKQQRGAPFCPAGLRNLESGGRADLSVQDPGVEGRPDPQGSDRVGLWAGEIQPGLARLGRWPADDSAIDEPLKATANGAHRVGSNSVGIDVETVESESFHLYRHIHRDVRRTHGDQRVGRCDETGHRALVDKAELDRPFDRLGRTPLTRPHHRRHSNTRQRSSHSSRMKNPNPHTATLGVRIGGAVPDHSHQTGDSSLGSEGKVERSTMSVSEQPIPRGSVIDITGDGPVSRSPGTEERIRHSFEHLLDAFAAFTALRDGSGRIVGFRLDYANERASAVAVSSGEGPAEPLVERHRHDLFDNFCRVVETGKPLATQSVEYEGTGAAGQRIARAFEVRAERVGDGLAVVWRDVTGHVRMERELERRNQELILIGEMVEYLQAAESSSEVFEIAANFCQRLFGTLSGGFFLQSESGSMVEAISAWGDGALGAQVFAPERCWAIRRGKRHGSLTANDSPRCPHAADGVRALLCVPLIVQGHETGLLVLADSGMSSLSNGPPSSAASEALAVSVCEHLGLALANIRLRESLREQSIRDPLTGLFNLRYMEVTLEREISRSARSQKPVGLMMLDVDRFKEFNDTFGHAGGDALLRELGALLRSVTREEDAACRYGGDEFVVLLPETSLDVTEQRAEEIRLAAKRFAIAHEGSILSEVTLTVGVAVYPDHGADMASLLLAADTAMYEAKHAGGDRVQVAQA